MPRTSKETFSRKKYFVWTADSTECLLEMWMENLSDFYGHRKNSHIMREMAESMKDYGLSVLEIKAKMDNMKKKYRKEFQILSSSGSKRSNWEYFSQMRHIMEYNEDEFESDVESMPKSSYDKSSRVKKESPKGNQSENEYSDSSVEFEFPEPDVNRNNSKRPHDEVYDDSDEEVPLKNLHFESSLTDEKRTESIHSENESERSIEFDFPELNAKRYKRERAKAMGEEMLALQRETLNVMRTMAKDLSSFHYKFLKALKPTHHKRST